MTPGGGIRLATTKNNAAPTRVLDLTRLSSRPGRQATGIDRVELAYLRHLIELEAPIWGLVRLSIGYVLLDRGGLASFMHRLQGRPPWGQTRPILWFPRTLTPLQRRVHRDLGRLAAPRRRAPPPPLVRPLTHPHWHRHQAPRAWRRKSATASAPRAAALISQPTPT